MPDRTESRSHTLALMQRLRQRDAAALRTLYDLHGPLLFGIALRLLRDRSEAEQLLIDVFAEIWQHAERYDPSRGDPLTYLVVLTRSRGLDRLRARPRRPSTPPLPMAEMESGDVGPSEQAATGERAQIVRDALAKLSVDERTAVELSFIDGLSHSEIADKLNKPLGTIKTHVRQGLIHLRTALRTLFSGDRDLS